MLRVAYSIVAALLVLSGPALAQQAPDSGLRSPAQSRAVGEPLVLQGSPTVRQRTQVPAQAPDGDDEAPLAAPTDNRPIIPEYQRRSGSRAGGPANDLNPSGRPEGGPLPGGDISAAVEGRDLYHGNYCGYGNRGEGLPPTDALDAACMRHDACYERAGYRSCGCDRTLEREANAVANSRRYSRQLRQRAGIIVQAGNVMECRSP